MTTKLVQIAVTERHIAEGRRGSCCWCPVALAVREHIRERFKVAVLESS